MKKDSARDAVVQEARELLVAMEAALLQIEMDGPSSDAINAIFRAAHTIKGSAGLFAFDSIIEFTHLVESVLDRVRNEQLLLDVHLMSLLLKCGDYIGELVDAIERQEEEVEPDLPRRTELETSLTLLLDVPELTVPLTIAKPVVPDTAAGGVASNPYWHLSLQFNQSVMRDGLDPVSFLHYLRTLGRIVAIITVQDDMPPAAQMDPETCYVGFEICLISDSSQQTLENVFEFVRDDSRIEIIAPHSALSTYGVVLQRLKPSTAQALGQAWHVHGALNADELDTLGIERSETLDDLVLPAVAVDLMMPPPRVPDVSSAIVGRAPPRLLEERRAQEQKFIKIEVAKLDQLIDLVGELVIAGAGARLIAQRRKDSQFEEATQAIHTLMEQIRDASLTLRMVQINEVFQRFPRVVRDLARDLDKDIELVMTGADTELDKSMVERIADPLMHIVRNAIDHGIEPASQRIAAGKPAKARLLLNASHESGSVVIEVMDDGRGMDRDRILATAISRGLTTADADLSDADIFRFVFEPGFSTARQVTALSGRGVGMDVVRRNIDALRGEIDIETEAGTGTVVRVRLPLTLAIISGFQVVVGNAVFVVPLDMVVECIDMPQHNGERHIVSVRDEALPYVPLRELFDMDSVPDQGRSRKSLVIVQYGQQRAGLLVDGLLGECQAVIKPLGMLFGKVKGLSGSTILGDGRVALILDIPHLIHYTQQHDQHQMAQPLAASSTFES